MSEIIQNDRIIYDILALIRDGKDLENLSSDVENKKLYDIFNYVIERGFVAGITAVKISANEDMVSVSGEPRLLPAGISFINNFKG